MLLILAVEGCTQFHIYEGKKLDNSQLAIIKDCVSMGAFTENMNATEVDGKTIFSLTGANLDRTLYLKPGIHRIRYSYSLMDKIGNPVIEVDVKAGHIYSVCRDINSGQDTVTLRIEDITHKKE